MGPYRRILVPIEGTPVDEQVLRHVRILATAQGAEVYLLRVAHYHTRDERVHEIDEARIDLERAAAELRSGGLTVHEELGHGEPAEAIIAAADRLEVDLIAMATHGHGWVQRKVLGSVSEAVRHGTKVPLLLLKEGWDQPRGDVDTSESDEQSDE
jgi:nucleotide-binding universal stress UspA family protein